MARTEKPARERSRAKEQHRQLRRNQIIFVVFSLFIIISMILSLVSW